MLPQRLSNEALMSLGAALSVASDLFPEPAWTVLVRTDADRGAFANIISRDKQVRYHRYAPTIEAAVKDAMIAAIIGENRINDLAQYVANVAGIPVIIAFEVDTNSESVVIG